MSAALAIDLYCGLGGWTEGLLVEGFEVIGFDNERHAYGEHRYPAQLVVQDVLTLHGSQFRDADLIVASPPCQEYSYMAMPWTRAKQIAAALRGKSDFPDGYRGSRTLHELNALFDACFRIQREASEAAGWHIPLIVENVKGAQPWVGRARWSFGSYYLWGDVPALMPLAMRAQKRNPDGTEHGSGSWFAIADSQERGARKNAGGSWFNIAHNTTSGCGQNPDGRKNPGTKLSDVGFNVASTRQFGDLVEGVKIERSAEDKRQHIGTKRKFASAMIAKIPLPLSRHIARTYRPASAL